ncbi:hypothetical protein [Microbacterium gorillae]|uniref:hypothetical protein n=1 Tax=Microbacterium gorillae TaxID=1231063 RepID=UPI003D97C96A
MASAESPAQASDYKMGLLTAPASEQDALPATILESQDGLNLDSVRFVASDGNASYWAGLNEKGDLCLLAQIGDKEWVAGVSCTTATMFLAHGTGLRLYGPEGLSEAYLVPDGAAVEAPVSAVAANLYVGDPYASADRRAAALDRVLSSGDGEFTLQVFPDAFTTEVPK